MLTPLKPAEGAVWRTPPGWPAPPEGWSPAPGWQPDPAWPAAPEGWQFWAPGEPGPQPRPGPFARFWARRAAVRAAKAAAAAAEALERAGRERAARAASLRRQISFVAGWPGSAPPPDGLVLHKGEHVVAHVRDAGIVEVKRQQGHYVAGSSGVSVRVAPGMRLRAGATRGHFEPGDETEMQVDSGTAVITNLRVTFSGARQSREWTFDHLLGHHLVANKRIAWVELPVSNRQRMSALSFPRGDADAVSSALGLALVFHRGEQEQLLAELRGQLAEVEPSPGVGEG